MRKTQQLVGKSPGYSFVGPDKNTPHHPHIWFNGEIVATRKCGFSPWIHGLHYSTAVISGIGLWKCRDGRYQGFRWPNHVRRLLYNLSAIGLERRFPHERILDGLKEISRLNLPALTQSKDLYLRAFAFQGSEELGVGSRGKTNLAIVTRDLTDYLHLGRRAGIIVLYPGFLFRRLHPSQGFPYAKHTGNYSLGALFKGVVAKQLELPEELAPDEILAQSWDGRELSETTGSNLFIVIDGIVYTPRLESWCLPGITRDTAICILRALDVKVMTNQQVTQAMLFRADEVFLSGTWSGIAPVTQILFDPEYPKPPADVYTNYGGAGFLPWLKANFQPKPIQAPFVGKVGPITQKVKDIYWQIVRGSGHKVLGCPMKIPSKWHTAL